MPRASAHAECSGCDQGHPSERCGLLHEHINPPCCGRHGLRNPHCNPQSRFVAASCALQLSFFALGACTWEKTRACVEKRQRNVASPQAFFEFEFKFNTDVTQKRRGRQSIVHACVAVKPPLTIAGHQDCQGLGSLLKGSEACCSADSSRQTRERVGTPSQVATLTSQTFCRLPSLGCKKTVLPAVVNTVSVGTTRAFRHAIGARRHPAHWSMS